jgi:hypothetical protein
VADNRTCLTSGFGVLQMKQYYLMNVIPLTVCIDRTIAASIHPWPNIMNTWPLRVNIRLMAIVSQAKPPSSPSSSCLMVFLSVCLMLDGAGKSQSHRKPYHESFSSESPSFANYLTLKATRTNQGYAPSPHRSCNTLPRVLR